VKKDEVRTMETTMTTNTVLTNEVLKRVAPSIFAIDKKAGLSEKYNFIPTSDVLKILFFQGWLPVKAQEMRVRDHASVGYQKHMIRFRNFNEQVSDKLAVGDTFMELVLTNAHNGIASFIFNLGMFRLACSNGMVVSESTFNSANIRHNSYDAKNVIEICEGVVKKAPQLLSEVEKLKAIELTPYEVDAFATSAKMLRFPEPEKVDNSLILRPRRSVDEKTDLWTTFNVVQENLIKGKLSYETVDKNNKLRSKHTKEVKAIGGSIALNQALWSLTESMAKLKVEQTRIIESGVR
jgi:hypothetical protein